MTADLHIHTTASDGRLSPGQVIEEAIRAGLSEIAITDHDTVDGLLDIYKNRRAVKQLAIIPGIEFSTDLPGHEVHILGYGIDIFSSILREQLARLLADRSTRAQKMVAKLNNLGYSIEYDRVLELSGKTSSIGRPHIARALLEKGYFSTISEVFAAVLDKNCPAYVPHYKMDIKTVLEVIKAAGGRSVLAHPGLIGGDCIVEDIINAGVDGLEAYHPTHNTKQISKYLAMAQKYNLLVTGGSDFHGIPGRYPEKLGDFTVSSQFAKKLSRIHG